MGIHFTKRMQILFFALLSSSLTLVLHVAGIEFHLYWVFSWYDILTHILGGVSLGLLFLILSKGKNVFLILLLIIILWEVFEVFVKGIDISTMEYWIDSITDVVVGLLSAYLSFNYFLQNRQPS